ncbi:MULTISPECIES: hypothetical protein [unclassified Saccharothrix]
MNNIPARQDYDTLPLQGVRAVLLEPQALDGFMISHGSDRGVM